MECVVWDLNIGHITIFIIHVTIEEKEDDIKDKHYEDLEN